ncbi:MAG: gamma-glutamyl-phosphate reductase, partial [Rhodospirillaceae bacterium TMED8]
MKTIDDIPALMNGIGVAAKEAASTLMTAPTKSKNLALQEAATALRRDQRRIIAENAKDMDFGYAKGLSSAMLDRLVLNEERIEGMASGLDDVAELPDPVGTVMQAWERPNGLKIERRRVPLGV